MENRETVKFLRFGAGQYNNRLRIKQSSKKALTAVRRRENEIWTSTYNSRCSC